MQGGKTMVGFEMGLETGGYDMMFTLVALLILGMIFVIIIRGIQQWHHNNQSPRLTVNAKVVSKRTNVSFHHHGHDHGVTSSTTYYVTFEVKSGDRLEFVVNGREYGFLVEGDYGELTFQGTRYIEFIRT